MLETGERGQRINSRFIAPVTALFDGLYITKRKRCHTPCDSVWRRSRPRGTCAIAISVEESTLSITLAPTLGPSTPAASTIHGPDVVELSAPSSTGPGPLSLRGFLDETIYPEASAVIFCAQGVWNPPRKVGRDLLVVYNAVAKQPLPPGTILLGREYWADGVLKHRDSREQLPEPELDPEMKKLIDEKLAEERRR